MNKRQAREIRRGIRIAQQVKRNERVGPRKIKGRLARYVYVFKMNNGVMW